MLSAESCAQRVIMLNVGSCEGGIMLRVGSRQVWDHAECGIMLRMGSSECGIMLNV